MFGHFAQILLKKLSNDDGNSSSLQGFVVLAPAIIDLKFDRSGEVDTSKWNCTSLTSVCHVLITCLQVPLLFTHPCPVLSRLRPRVLLLVIGSPLRDKRSVYWFW